MPKFPEPPPPAELAKLKADEITLAAGTLCWRIYFAGGPRPSAWSAFRAYGPNEASRFDHHEPPAREQERRILYIAARVLTCIAEVFQETRTIEVSRNSPWLVGFRLARAVKLLDLSGSWPTRAGASQAISSGFRPRARAWSRAIYEAYPSLAGLRYPSSMDGNQPAYAFYERAERALPDAPEFHRALNDPAIAAVVDAAGKQFGYFVV